MMWQTVLALNVMFMYSLAPIIKEALWNKLRSVKAYSLVYVTGFHLVFFTYCLLYMNSLLPTAAASYLVSLILVAKEKYETIYLPYLYLAWSLLVAAAKVGW